MVARILSFYILFFFILVLETILLLSATEVFFRVNRRAHFIDFMKYQNEQELHALSLEENHRLRKIDWSYLANIPDGFSHLRGKPQSNTSDIVRKIFTSVPNAPFSHEETSFNTRGDLIYHVIYSADSHERRITPGKPLNAKKSLFLIGCSLTFGEGLPGDQTMPAYLQTYFRKTSVWNFGIRGGSINHQLQALRESDINPNHGFYAAIPNKPTILVYNFINDHVPRAQCPLSCYKDKNSWMMNGADFSVEKNGEVKYLGKFSETRIINPFIRLFVNSAFVDSFQLDWPSVHDESGVPKFLALLKMFRQEIRSKIELSAFYVVLYPYPFNKDTYSEPLARLLAKEGFKVIDLRGLDLAKVTGQRQTIPFDLHSSAQANFVISQLILDHIKEDHPEFR